MKRRRSGISGSTDKRSIARNPQLVEMLHLPTGEVNRRTGMKGETIRKLRKELGVTAMPLREFPWTPELLARPAQEPGGRSVPGTPGVPSR